MDIRFRCDGYEANPSHQANPEWNAIPIICDVHALSGARRRRADGCDDMSPTL